MGFLKDLHEAGKKEMKKRDRERAEEERKKIEMLNEAEVIKLEITVKGLESKSSDDK